MPESISPISPIAKKKAGRFSVLLATGLGLGCLPMAPGTWGSLLSLALYFLLERSIPRLGSSFGHDWPAGSAGFLAVQLLFNGLVAIVGVWTSDSAADYFGEPDPGRVVIDEISGQQIVFIGLAPVGWKVMLAGFVLFRLFDIWKPFPARQAESLPGGWGIMTDDWFAALYALLILWIARLMHIFT
ncbi:MAG: phosphatidylglycerophosphatase A [Acidipila sp.]|nr:phosphatidylglycerophosphatase A [Acidipila sp.]